MTPSPTHGNRVWPKLRQDSINKTSEDVIHETSEDEGYQYQPLEKESHQIRVLALQKSDQGLCCEIRQISLKPEFYSDSRSLMHQLTKAKKKNYIALSYEWGTIAKTEKLHVIGENGRKLGSVQITESLSSALADIWESDLAPKVVFADQICIDQNNIAELNHQVAHMGDVYRQAALVVSYLGPRTDGDEDGLALLKRIQRYFSPEWDSFLAAYGESRNHPAMFAGKRLKHKLDVSRPGWTAVQSMVWGGWCNRLWMCPESILNDDIVFLRGPLTLDWYLVAGVHLLSRARRLKPVDELRKLGGGSSYSNCAAGILRIRLDPDASTLLNNLWSFGNLKCSNPKDRLYGLLSISSDADELGIRPDYSVEKSIHETYMDASIEIYRVYSAELFIMTELYPPSREGWESWLPDWTSLRHFYSPGAWEAADLRRSIRSKASGSRYWNFPTSFIYDESVERTACVLTGQIFDQIESHLPVINPFNRETRKAEGEKKSFVAAVEFAGNEGFADDMIASCCISFGGKGPFTLAKLLPTDRDSLESVPGTTLRHYLDKSGTDITKLDRFWSAKRDQIRNQRFGVTACKRLSLVHVDSRPGDVLARFDGWFLAVLRARGDGHYSYVGRAFAHEFTGLKRFGILGPFEFQKISIV